ncbi:MULTISPECIES: helix-turn-helix domain-containing protein [unclassified Streptomyces]|uniref:helix-turn-helix domain-containing protein n=1 Tax=unclassified Streptomyces TaxID=2593676 RepID=UPI0004C8313B|nr:MULTISPECIES: Scr1 family TA system antitoxin-like transcriptional regulator [unclassified Streptomyces]MDX6758364.1 Scr1 family TA system antitoxin-like transcriptional regulator [Streptomyces sp. F8]
MPPRSTPTARQRRLGSELRRLREESGTSVQWAAALLGVDRTRIPNIESGRIGISAERVRTLARHYGCRDPELVDLLAAMAQERHKGWWERHRGTLPPGLLDICELEHHSVRLHTAVTTHIPGLLQTEAHARAVFGAADPPLPEAELQARLALRMSRQQVFARERPPLFEAVVHEAALRMRFGGTGVAREQLQHVLAQSERERTTVLVIPFGVGGLPGSGQSFTYAAAALGRLDTVQLDSSHGSMLVDSDAKLARYRGLLERLRSLALPAAASRDFIRAVARDL